jgi:hypothetical protein
MSELVEQEEPVPNIELSAEESAKFKLLALSYFEMDDEIQILNNAVKQKKKARKEIGDKIIDFMKDIQIDHLATDKGKLKYSVTEKKIGLSKKVLQQKLSNFFANNNEKAVDLFKFIDNREKVEKGVLKVQKVA